MWVDGSGKEPGGHEPEATQEFVADIRNDYEAPDVMQAVHSVDDVRQAVQRASHTVHSPVPVFS